jgi:hypothetical protein
MQAYWPNLYLAGDPSGLPADPAMVVTPAPYAEVARWQADWSGVDRTPELAYWASLPDPRPFVVREGGSQGRVVGAGIGRARFSGVGRWLDQAMAAPDADGPAVLLAALRHGLAGSDSGGGCVPGASPLAASLLGLGFRIADHDTFLASEPTLVDPLREIVNTGLL